MPPSNLPSGKSFVNITGVRFGRLVATEFAGSGRQRRRQWKCVCDCGNEVVVSINRLKDGRTRSCGCLKRDRIQALNRTHGQSKKTKEYAAWCALKGRCCNPKNKRYQRYGGRGIKVCDRWQESFEAFFEDMGKKPEGTSIDRIDNDKGYEPGNCRWATPSQQARNRKGNRLLTFNGETRCLADWGDIVGLSFRLLKQRVSAGWSAGQVLGYLPR